MDDARSYRFWLWPQVLSLDAPLVAVAWQLLLARSVTPIPPVQTWILGLTVWLIYTLDRVLDGLRPPDPRDAPRHRFARAFRKPLLATAAVVLVIDLTLAIGYLEAIRLERGLLIAALVGVHFYLTHRQSRPWPKELWIGILFAAGVWLPALVAVPGMTVFIETLLFAALCWWNCVAIEVWEGSGGRWHASTRWLAPRLRPAAFGIVLAAAVVYAVTHQPAAAAAALSAGVFWWLAGQSRNLSPEVLRLAVDMALLTPVLC